MKENNTKIYVVIGCINYDYGHGLPDKNENVKAFHSLKSAEDFIDQLRLKKHKKNSPEYGGGRSYYKSPLSKEVGYYSMDIEEIEFA